MEERIRFIGEALGTESTAANLHQTRVILDQIADLVRDDGSGIGAGDCAHLLEHLTRIYACGGVRREYSAFSATASAYARVIKALSRRYPTCDYKESIGQLLDLMTCLFETRDPNWKSIFRLLRAMPSSAKGRGRLQRVCSTYIPEWFEDGVPNLYPLQKELHRDIERLDLEIEALHIEIRTTGEELKTIRGSACGTEDPKIANLAEKRKERQILRWQRRTRHLIGERDAQTKAVVLIASDIHELGNRFRAAGRAYRLRLV